MSTITVIIFSLLLIISFHLMLEYLLFREEQYQNYSSDNRKRSTNKKERNNGIEKEIPENLEKIELENVELENMENDKDDMKQELEKIMQEQSLYQPDSNNNTEEHQLESVPMSAPEKESTQGYNIGNNLHTTPIRDEKTNLEQYFSTLEQEDSDTLLQKIKQGHTPEEPSVVSNTKDPINQNENENQWSYENENIMNGGEISPGLKGFINNDENYSSLD